MKWAVWLTAWSVAGSFAATLRVPAEYASIQLALDAAASFDTVLIAPGLYAEAPVTPVLSSLWIRGEYWPDSSIQNAVVDPTTIQGSDTLACLGVRGTDIHIEQLGFRNGPAMYEHRMANRVGGVRLETQTPVTLTGCRFDSVFYAIGPPGRVVLDACAFRNVQYKCVDSRGRPLIATDCSFSAEGFMPIQCGDSSRIFRCTFRDAHGTTRQLSAVGTEIEIMDCIFGPNGPLTDAGVYEIQSTGNCRFEGNLISGNYAPPSFNGTSVIHIRASCQNTATVRENFFTDNIRVLPLHIWCPYDSNLQHVGGFVGEIGDNRFQSCTCPVNNPGLVLYGEGALFGNRFLHLEGAPNSAGFWVYSDSTADTATVLRDNIFIGTGRAVQSSEHVDARWNYWGDSTGPFNAIFNPGGQGDAVGDCVLVAPWYPDTNFVAAPEPRSEHPESYSLLVYPNPFNSTATILLQVPEPSIVRVELFDILGRRVRELWNGPVAYERELAFRADDLASGIYFVRAYQAAYMKTLALTKLVLLK